MIKKKSLGQNFLKSQTALTAIINAGKIVKEDTVLEIGPGEGVLTVELLKTGARVWSIEKDDRLIPVLQEKFAKEIVSGQLTLIHDDVLETDMSKRHFDIKKYKLVANIPYYITGQILRIFLESENQPESMTILVQKEVAERIVAKENKKHGKESLLSLSVKVFGEPEYVRTVGRGAFSPQPTVDSAVLHIADISKRRLSGVDQTFFFTIIHAGFAHKRKQLLPNLSELFSKDVLQKAFDICNIETKARAEDVPLETWVKLCKVLMV